MIRTAIPLIKRYGSPVLDATGLLDWRLNRLLDHNDRLLVLMYHRVIEQPALDPFRLGMCVSREHFAAQIDYLVSELRPIGLSEAVRRLANGQALPRRSVAITFDDGYLDNHQIAAPILASRSVPATFFVVTGGLGEARALWWDRAIHALASTRQTRLHLPALSLPGPVALDGDHRQAGAVAVLDALWRLAPDELPGVLDELVAQLAPQAQSDELALGQAPRMSQAQVASLHTMGFEIGAHTVSHLDMRHLSPQRIEAELIESRQVLSSLCGQPVAGFAYPSGFLSTGLQHAVRTAGFDYAVSTERGINGQPLLPFALARIGMPDSPVADFKRALCRIPVWTGGQLSARPD